MSAAGSGASYFANHRLGRRFPWSLYHRPIDAELRRFLAALPGGASVLNVGCGAFLNLPDLPTHVRYTGCDVDQRAIDACRIRYPQIELKVAQPLSLPFDDHAFDAVYATEVIEHCVPAERWLVEVMRVCRPGGGILLTTPNYASLSLQVLEATALEVIARAQGFTRRGIHPFQCTAPTLEALVRAVGGVAPRTKLLAFGWVIALEFSTPP